MPTIQINVAGVNAQSTVIGAMAGEVVQSTAGYLSQSDRYQSELDGKTRASAEELTNSASLDNAAADLEYQIQFTGNMYESDYGDCVACDAHFAGEFANLTTEVQALTRKFETIRDSFCPTGGIINFDNLYDIKSTMSQDQQDIISTLMVDVLVAKMMPHGTDGEPAWDLIREMLGRSYESISDSEFAALALVFTHLQADADVARFISYMATREYDLIQIHHGTHIMAAENPEQWRAYLISRGVDPDNFPGDFELYATSDENARDYTLWSFNPVLVTRLMFEVEVVYINALIDNAMVSGSSNENLIRIAERSDMLGFVSQIEGNITSVRGQNGPYIRIDSNHYMGTGERIGYRLTYTMSPMHSGGFDASRNDINLFQDMFSHMYEKSFMASVPAFAGFVTSGQMIDTFEESVIARYTPNATGIILSNALGQSPIPTGGADVINAALEAAGNKPWVRAAYHTFNITYGSWSDYKAANETLSAGMEGASIALLTDATRDFHLITTIVTDHSNGYSFTMRPTGDTLTTLGELNNAIDSLGRDGRIISTDDGFKILNLYDNGYVAFSGLSYDNGLTLRDIETNLTEIQRLYENRTVRGAINSLAGG